MADAVKVSMATAEHTNEGTVLKMMTVDRVEIQFLLDDLAIGLLGMTLQSVLSAAKERASQSDDNIRLFTREGGTNE